MEATKFSIKPQTFNYLRNQDDHGIESFLSMCDQIHPTRDQISYTEKKEDRIFAHITQSSPYMIGGLCTISEKVIEIVGDKPQ